MTSSLSASARVGDVATKHPWVPARSRRVPERWRLRVDPETGDQLVGLYVIAGWVGEVRDAVGAHAVRELDELPHLGFRGGGRGAPWGYRI